MKINSTILIPFQSDKDKKGSKKAIKKDSGRKSGKSTGNGLLIHDDDQLLMSDSESSSDEDGPKKGKVCEKNHGILEEIDSAESNIPCLTDYNLCIYGNFSCHDCSYHS